VRTFKEIMDGECANEACHNPDLDSMQGPIASGDTIDLTVECCRCGAIWTVTYKAIETITMSNPGRKE
jgi:hypothetical protein